MKRFLVPLFLLALAPFVGACAMTTADRYAASGAAIGAAAGAAAGAVVGVVTGNPAKGAAIGAVAGGAIGGFKGYSRGAEIERREAEAAAAQAAAIAAQQPWRKCYGYYDHTGSYRYWCNVEESGPHAGGIPNMPLPPPEKLVPMGVGVSAPAAPAPPPPPPPAPQTWQGRPRNRTGYYAPVRRTF